ncbi:hypothetical protein, partial [Gordonia sp. 852002-10350_SCH5691597]|uniref:hypothetical protein n=1 Tax=Gordonia sp. 852002-10350_SCH5691597 TaxID=1834085 RepID=UPI001E50A719
MLAGVLGGVEDEGGVVVGGVVVGGVVGGVVVVGAVVDGVVTDGADVPTSAWAPPTPRDRHAATTATVLENERKYVNRPGFAGGSVSWFRPLLGPGSHGSW